MVWETQNVPSDGSCLFESLSRLLKYNQYDSLPKLSSSELRNIVAERVRNRHEDAAVESWFETFDSKPSRSESYSVVHGLAETYKSQGLSAIIDTVADRMNLHSYWGNEFVLSVLSKHLRVNLVVVGRMRYPRNSDQYKFTLYLRLKNLHYEPLFYDRQGVHSIDTQLPPIPGSSCSYVT